MVIVIYLVVNAPDPVIFFTDYDDSDSDSSDIDFATTNP